MEFTAHVVAWDNYNVERGCGDNPSIICHQNSQLCQGHWLKCQEIYFYIFAWCMLLLLYFICLSYLLTRPIHRSKRRHTGGTLLWQRFSPNPAPLLDISQKRIIRNCCLLWLDEYELKYLLYYCNQTLVYVLMYEFIVCR